MEKVIKAYAKINIGLHVKGKTENGYHLLDMIMTPIDLYDNIHFIDSDKIEVEMNKDICDMEKNLCYKVAKYLHDTYNIDRGIKITIYKNIPSGAGLGGGSSDAATVLTYLNSYWNINISKNDLMNIGMKFGCDIPFFIENKISHVEGFGEMVTPLMIKENNKQILLVVPPFQMNTATVFKNFSEYKENQIINSLNELKKGNIIPFNDLEDTVNKLTNNKIEEIKNIIKSNNIENIVMTGSGSVLVAYLNNTIKNCDLNNIRNELKECKIISTNLKMYTY